jgi:hypothetical protein
MCHTWLVREKRVCRRAGGEEAGVETGLGVE